MFTDEGNLSGLGKAMVCAALLLTVLAVGFALDRRGRSLTTALAGADPHAAAVAAGEDACRQWTKEHARLGVAKVLREYEIPGATRLPADHVLVGLDWRAQGSGMLMASACEASVAHDGSITLLREQTGFGK